MIQDILTVKIERNIYVNEEKAVSEIQILINKTFLLFSHHELLMHFIIREKPLLNKKVNDNHRLQTAYREC